MKHISLLLLAQLVLFVGAGLSQLDAAAKSSSAMTVSSCSCTCDPGGETCKIDIPDGTVDTKTFCTSQNANANCLYGDAYPWKKCKAKACTPEKGGEETRSIKGGSSSY